MLKESAVHSSASVRDWLDQKTLGQEHGCDRCAMLLLCDDVMCVRRSSAFIKDLKKSFAKLINVMLVLPSTANFCFPEVYLTARPICSGLQPGSLRRKNHENNHRCDGARFELALLRLRGRKVKTVTFLQLKDCRQLQTL